MTAHSAFPGYEWGYDPAKGADKSAFTLLHETPFGVVTDAVVYGQTADLLNAAFQALCAVQEQEATDE